MTKKIVLICVVFIILICGFFPALAEDAKTATDLTGVWNVSFGGKFYIRQYDKNIVWYGENAPAGTLWSNVAFGTIEGNKITIQWSDVPKGAVKANGSLIIEIVNNKTLQLKERTGGFGGLFQIKDIKWTKIK